jgi:hypothetical protein
MSSWRKACPAELFLQIDWEQTSKRLQMVGVIQKAEASIDGRLEPGAAMD